MTWKVVFALENPYFINTDVGKMTWKVVFAPYQIKER